MPRIARVVCPGVPFHVTQRGNRRCSVFCGDQDRLSYLGNLQDYAGQHGLAVLAYCLMSNHVHLVVVPETHRSLERVLRPLHMRHAQRINLLRSWKGHLWQGRYFAAALDATYLWAAIHYVERNPVVAGLVTRAEDYPWSSASAHCGLRSDALLTRDPTWVEQFRCAGDWSAWLACEEDPAERELLRRNTAKGLPCGPPEFMKLLAERTGRQIDARPHGRSPTRSRSSDCKPASQRP